MAEAKESKCDLISDFQACLASIPLAKHFVAEANDKVGGYIVQGVMKNLGYFSRLLCEGKEIASFSFLKIGIHKLVSVKGQIENILGFAGHKWAPPSSNLVLPIPSLSFTNLLKYKNDF